MNTRKENIIFMTEFIIKTISVIAVIFLAQSIIAMIEAMLVFGTPFIVFIVCSAWLGLVGIYAKLVDR